MGQKLFKKLGNKFTPDLRRTAPRCQGHGDSQYQEGTGPGDERHRALQRGRAEGGLRVMRGTYMLPCTPLPIFNSLYPNVHLDIMEENSGVLESTDPRETDLRRFQPAGEKP